jgi:hypothetical protein
VLATSKDKRNVRQSRVELEFAPRQTYALESTYSMTTPLVLDLNLATPLYGYEAMSASFRHNMRDAGMDTSALVGISVTFFFILSYFHFKFKLKVKVKTTLFISN